jgi:CelD/BcsL family acetyltransferase involved in cellulose biosynthesis
MGVLFIDDEPAAAQFWIVRGGKATIYKLVYAEEFARFSPGTLLTMEMMRRVLEQDSPAQVDFGRGDDAYKKLWLSSRSERWGIEAANPRTLNGLPRSFWILAGGVRSAVKRKLSRSEPQSRVQG